MKNIRVLPTDKPSRLYFDVVTKELHLQKRLSLNATSFPIEKRNIYITNDEETLSNNGDYYLGYPNYNTIHKWNMEGMHENKQVWIKKIILTTDQDLIKDGVKAIDDEFLEWFVKNPSCEKVGVINTFDYNKKHFVEHSGYKIIIPKEEPKKTLEKYSERFDNKENELLEGVFNPENWGKRIIEEPKQETLEEALERIRQESFTCCSLSKSINYVTVGEREKTAFYKGAKWQAERMYSEEEVRNIVEQTIEKFYKHRYVETKSEMKELWFEQFKKK
jgi:hypothetical protein